MTNYYLLGSTWIGNKKGYDQTERFLREGIWENGYDDKFTELINQVNVGDRVAIKASFAKGKESILRIKALGTVTFNPKNGKTLNVNWDSKSTSFDLKGLGGYRNTIQKVKKADIALIFKTVDKQVYSDQLRKFLEQAKTNSLGVVDYKKEFYGMKTRVSFGQGNVARIPWIAFLHSTQKVQNGIYPVYLYYKDKGTLILAYGISETEKPMLQWNLKNPQTIQEFFNTKLFGKAERYGSSYVYKVYKIEDLPSNDTLDRELIQLLDEYKHISFGAPKSTTKYGELFNINSFIESCSNVGLIYSVELHIRFVASLLTKPLLLLTGLSGSGKTKLAQAFAAWICENPDQFVLLPVGADWTNREPLLGYPNALKSEEYVVPDSGVVNLLMKANQDTDKPYFLILDEMNLSHVERYFADFLSVMESDDSIKLYDGANRVDTKNQLVSKQLYWPKNLFIIGTVNIDETTYMFSPKVLDRANTIEFRVSVDEMQTYFENNKTIEFKNLVGKGAHMAADFIDLAVGERDEIEQETEIHAVLILFFTVLQKTGAEFGYRTAGEMLKLIYNLWQIDTNLTQDEKVDIAVIQKLLPKLHGSRNKLKKPLEALAALCLVDQQSFKPDLLTGNLPAEAAVRFPLSFEKLGRMYRNLMENGYTSFAEA